MSIALDRTTWMLLFRFLWITCVLSYTALQTVGAETFKEGSQDLESNRSQSGKLALKLTTVVPEVRYV